MVISSLTFIEGYLVLFQEDTIVDKNRHSSSLLGTYCLKGEIDIK